MTTSTPSSAAAPTLYCAIETSASFWHLAFTVAAAHRRAGASGIRNSNVEFYFRARYGVKSCQICWSTFGSTTRVSPFSGAFSE